MSRTNIRFLNFVTKTCKFRASQIRRGNFGLAIIPLLISILMLGISPTMWLGTPDALENPQSTLVIPAPHPVIPANAGIQTPSKSWIPDRVGDDKGVVGDDSGSGQSNSLSDYLLST